MKTSDFSIVIPSRGRPSLNALLTSLQEAFSPPPRIIVVLDGVRGDTFLNLKREFPESEILPQAKPMGPSMARNRGLSRSRTAWTVFLDDDLSITPKWVQAISDFSPDKETVIAEGPTLVQKAVSSQQRQASEIDFEGGFGAGNLMVRTRTFREIGGFDMRYFKRPERLHFREDTDLGLRMLKVGKSAYLPDLICIHPAEETRDFWHLPRFARRYYFESYFLARNEDAREWIGGFIQKGRLRTRQTRGTLSLLIPPGYFFSLFFLPCLYLTLALHAVLALLIFRRQPINRTDIISVICQGFVYPFFHAWWYVKGLRALRNQSRMLFGYQSCQNSGSCTLFASFTPLWEGWKITSSDFAKSS